MSRIVEGATPGRLTHLEEAARVHDELFPHLAPNAADRTPQRDVEELRAQIEQEIDEICTTDSFYRPWNELQQPSAAL